MAFDFESPKFGNSAIYVQHANCDSYVISKYAREMAAGTTIQRLRVLRSSRRQIQLVSFALKSHLFNMPSLSHLVHGLVTGLGCVIIRLCTSYLIYTSTRHRGLSRPKSPISGASIHGTLLAMLNGLSSFTENMASLCGWDLITSA